MTAHPAGATTIHHNARYTTIFIVNLAFADFLYCLVNLPLYSLTVSCAATTLQFLTRLWPGSHTSCQYFAVFRWPPPSLWSSILWRRYFNAYAAWMSVGMVALSRWVLIFTAPYFPGASASCTRT